MGPIAASCPRSKRPSPKRVAFWAEQLRPAERDRDELAAHRARAPSLRQIEQLAALPPPPELLAELRRRKIRGRRAALAILVARVGCGPGGAPALVVILETLARLFQCSTRTVSRLREPLEKAKLVRVRAELPVIDGQARQRANHYEPTPLLSRLFLGFKSVDLTECSDPSLLVRKNKSEKRARAWPTPKPPSPPPSPTEQKERGPVAAKKAVYRQIAKRQRERNCRHGTAVELLLPRCTPLSLDPLPPEQAAILLAIAAEDAPHDERRAEKRRRIDAKRAADNRRAAEIRRWREAKKRRDEAANRGGVKPDEPPRRSETQRQAPRSVAPPPVQAAPKVPTAEEIEESEAARRALVFAWQEKPKGPS